MKQSIAFVALVVRDYDEAIAFFTEKLLFTLIEDRFMPEQNRRWVTVAPPGSTGTGLVLARPSNDGQVIRIAIPPLTEERRKQLVKLVHGHVEEGKVALRNIRRDAMASVKGLVNDKAIGEDDERRAEHQVDGLTKQYVGEADRVGKSKEQEVLEH